MRLGRGALGLRRETAALGDLDRPGEDPGERLGSLIEERRCHREVVHVDPERFR